MLPSPASSLSFPSPLERREADPYARCDRQRPACNESHEPAQERPEPVATCAFIEEERRRGDPTGLLYALGPRSGESRSGWRSGWRRWSTISTWTVPLSRRGQRWERSAAKPRRAFAAAAANPSIFATSARRCCCWEPISPPGPRRRRRRCAATGAEECSPPSAAGAEMGDVVALALGGDLAAVHQGVADHEVDQGRRDAQFLAMSFCGTPCRRYISKA